MGDAGATVIEGILKEIVEAIIAEFKHQCNYLCCFNNNVQTLDEKAQKLEIDKATLQRTVDDAKRDGLDILPAVNYWLEETKKCQANKMELENGVRDVQNGCCLNITLRYSVGRQVNKTAEAMEKLLKANPFGNDVAQPAPMVPFQAKSNTLQGRQEMEDSIFDALKRPDVNIVGIWGSGGAGKTFTARSVVKRMMTDELVHEAVMVVVSQEESVLIIQQKIADLVRLTLDSKIESAARADQLRKRLKSQGRKIIIVDDVWEKLNFEEIGIPCTTDSGGCKILLTSRKRQLLHQMDALIFPLDTLTKEDAWSLFRDKVGDCVDNTNLKPIAEHVLDECKRLPLAILTVGSALKDQHQTRIWENALHQLKNAALKEIDGVEKYVYGPLRLSYDNLKSDGAKSLFLLCCIFLEDFEISLEDLALYGMGLKKFGGVHTLSQARNQVLALVDNLKNCALLLDEDKMHVKMHDVVRDVARFIVNEEGKFIGEHLWLKSKSAEDSYYKIESNFQCCRLLIIQYDGGYDRYMTIDGFPSVKGIQELEVLSLKQISLELIDCHLENLKTLELIDCLLKNLSFVGKLRDLEILKCNSCYEVEELPIEIGYLERLKLLDLSNCENLKRIRAGVISKLKELEELKMLNSFKEWESTEIINEEEVEHNACLKELEALKKLTCLEIEIANIELVEENMCLSESIVNYQIQIGRHKFIHEDKVVSSCPCLFPKHNDCFVSWIHKFVSASQELYLDGDWSRKFIPSNSYGSMVQKLQIQDGEELASPVNARISTDLRGGGVSKHDKKLVIFECEKMEEVFIIEKKEQVGKQSNLTFLKLVKMEIQEMPNLTAFGKRIESIEFPFLTELKLKGCPKFKWIDFQDGCNHDEDFLHYFCNKKVTFGNLKELTIKKCDIARSLRCQQIPSQFFEALEKVTIGQCHNIKVFCSFSIAKSFTNLKELSINNCDSMKCVIGVEKQTYHSSTKSSEILEEFSRNEENEDGGTIWPFPKLEILKLCRLKNFKTLSERTRTFELQMLCSLTIEKCPDQNKRDGCNSDSDSLHLFCDKQLPYSSSPLRDLNICGFDNVINLWCQQIPPCFFLTLESLLINDCTKLKSAFPYSIVKHLHSLKALSIRDCTQMELVVSDLENKTHEQNSISFPSLAHLSLYNVPSMEMFCEPGCSLILPSLESMVVNRHEVFGKSTNEGVVEDWNDFLRQHLKYKMFSDENVDGCRIS